LTNNQANELLTILANQKAKTITNTNRHQFKSEFGLKSTPQTPSAAPPAPIAPLPQQTIGLGGVLNKKNNRVIQQIRPAATSVASGGGASIERSRSSIASSSSASPVPILRGTTKPKALTLNNVLASMPLEKKRKAKLASNYIKEQGFPKLNNKQLEQAIGVLGLTRQSLRNFRKNFGR